MKEQTVAGLPTAAVHTSDCACIECVTSDADTANRGGMVPRDSGRGSDQFDPEYDGARKCAHCGGYAHVCEKQDEDAVGVTYCRLYRIAREFCLDLRDCNPGGENFIKHTAELLRETEDEAWGRLSEARTKRIEQLERVLEVLELEEADENGHDIVGAAQLLEHDMHHMGEAVEAADRLTEAASELRAQWPEGGCVQKPACGNCTWCRFVAALEKAELVIS